MTTAGGPVMPAAPAAGGPVGPALPAAGEPVRPAVPAAGEPDRPARDAFPHTRRPLPWLLAGFVVMLFLVPIDSTQLKLHLPVDSHIDRFALLGLVLAWLVLGGDQRAFVRTPRSKLFVTGTCLFLTLAVASLLLDAGRIINLGDFTLAEKRFALLCSFLILSWFALTSLRYEDVRGFSTLLIVLGTILAIGIIVERRTGYNVFYNWSAVILGPIANVAPSPTDIHPALGSDGRVFVSGPTLHGLAAAAMLVMVMPFALVRVFDARSRRTWWVNAAIFGLMFAGAMATEKKTVVIAVAGVVLYLAIYRTRQILRLAPVGIIVLTAVIHFAAPGAIGTTLDLGQAFGSNSTAHRVGDFSSVAPDIGARLLLGRGYGSVDESQPQQFRINDNQYIDAAWQVGVLGLAAYMFMILAPVLAARRAIRSRDPTLASLALSAAAACVAFFVVNALFDALSFPQAPYVFFAVAALSTVASAGPAGNVVPSSVQRSSPPRRLAPPAWEA